MKLAPSACVSLEWAVAVCFNAGGCLGGCTFNEVGKARAYSVGHLRRAGPAVRATLFLPRLPRSRGGFQGIADRSAQLRARNFVQGLGENVDGYQSTITFQVDDNAKTYLERELGLQEANRLMSSELNVWFWEVRFFKPQQEEEFQVRVSPAGKVVAYSHKIEEARGAKSLSREEALSAAQQFLRDKESAQIWTTGISCRKKRIRRTRQTGWTGPSPGNEKISRPRTRRIGWKSASKATASGARRNFCKFRKPGRARTSTCAPPTFSTTRSR